MGIQSGHCTCLLQQIQNTTIKAGGASLVIITSLHSRMQCRVITQATRIWRHEKALNTATGTLTCSRGHIHIIIFCQIDASSVSLHGNSWCHCIHSQHSLMALFQPVCQASVRLSSSCNLQTCTSSLMHFQQRIEKTGFVRMHADLHKSGQQQVLRSADEAVSSKTLCLQQQQ